ncbi:MAG: flagellar hook-associated protein 3 [Acidimicrobiaceae bacterium]|nr:flagellar hook-associated protein 3 [Acidimicrobiaceae bacterium]
MSSIPSTSAIVITPSVLTNSMISGLTTDQANLATIEQQVSTGDAINAASDNPAGAASILQMQGSVTRANQYAANSADGVGWLSLGNSTVDSVLSVLQSVKSVVEGISGSSLTSDSATLTSTSAQVGSALSQLLNLANTTEAGGQPIFAGTGNATASYDANGNYLGNSTAPTRTVAPGTMVAVAATGPEVFGSGTTGLLGTGQGGSTAGVLQQIVNDLNTASSATTTAARNAAIQNVTGTDLTNLTAALSQSESAAGVLGANQQSVQNFATQATGSLTAIQGELGSVQDTNMAQALTSLQLQQAAYQSALYATSQLSADSLVKYL